MNKVEDLVSVVFFLNRLEREENLSQVSQQSSTVVVSLGVIWGRAAKTVSCSRRVTVLTNVTSTLVPLVGRLVDKSQVGMEQSVAGQEEEDKDQKAKHEDDSGEGQEQMLYNKQRSCWLLLAVLIYITGPQKP